MKRLVDFVLMLALSVCGGGPAAPTPAPAPSPKPSVLLARFSDNLTVGGVGIVTPPPTREVPGTYKVILRWDPGPPASQMSLARR